MLYRCGCADRRCQRNGSSLDFSPAIDLTYDQNFISVNNLRAPVASVPWLINLASRIELDDDSKVLVNYLQRSAEKLDDIVHAIMISIEKGE